MKIPYDEKHVQMVVEGHGSAYVKRDGTELEVVIIGEKNISGHKCIACQLVDSGTELIFDHPENHMTLDIPKFKVGDHITYRGDNYEIKSIKYYGRKNWVYNVGVIGVPNDPEEVKTGIGKAAEDCMEMVIDASSEICNLLKLSDVECCISNALFKHTSMFEIPTEKCIDMAKEIAPGVVEFVKDDFKKRWNKYLTPQEVTDIYNDGIKRGYEELLAKLPKWKIADRDIFSDCIEFAVVYRHDGGDYPDWDEVIPSNRVLCGEKYFEISDLEELPSFK